MMAGISANEEEQRKQMEDRLDQEMLASFTSYEQWKSAAQAQQGAEGEVSLELKMVASKKGWLEQWSLIGEQEEESKAALKRGRLSTEGAAFVIVEEQKVEAAGSDMELESKDFGEAETETAAAAAPTRPTTFATTRQWMHN